MSGRLIGVFIVGMALIAGAAIYFLQLYAFYEEIDASADPAPVRLVSLTSGQPEPILIDDFRAIDSSSSPIRYRACFTTPMSQALLTETFVTHPDPVPLVAPGWFDCFDATDIAERLETGTAIAFLGESNIHYGVDRIVAILDDGRGFAWNQLNDCGEKAYDGSAVGPDCPPREGND